MFAPLILDEPARLAALCRLDVLDTPPEPEFDDLTRLAAVVCGTPIALVSLVDACRQWFKSRHGLDAAETPRDVAFCAHAITQTDLFVVPDATADPRFRDNPLVTGGPKIRFYAGTPLVTADGHALGTLCVIDTTPRTLTAVQADALRVLGRQVVAQLALRQKLHSTQVELRQHETFRVLFESSSDAHLLFDETDGIIDCNDATVAMLRYQDKSQVLALHPAVLSPEFQPDGRRSMEKCVEMDATARRDGYHRFDWTHRRADGEDFPCEVTLTPTQLHGRTVLLVVWHDLTERKKFEDAVRASEERFRLATAAGGVGVWEWNLRTNRISWNDEMFRLYGVVPTPDGVVPYEAWSEAVLSEDLPRQVDYLRETIDRCGSGSRAFRIRVAGGVREVEASEVVRTNAHGRAEWVVGTNVDVTARNEAERRLAASEQRFRAFMNNSPVVAFMKDEAGRYTYVNEPLVRRFGKPAEFWLGRTDEALFPDTYTSAWRENDRTVLAGGKMVEFNESVLHDGGVTHWTTYKFPFRDAAGQVFLAGVGLDVTDKKRAEDALRESEERFRSAFEDAPIGMALVAPDGRWLRVNRALCGMIGYTPDELLATDFQTITHPDDLYADLDLVRQVLSGELATYQMEKRYFHKRGPVVHALLAVTLVRDAAGEPLHFVSQIKDITARKAAEDALRASEAKFRCTVDRLAEGVFILDPSSRRFVEANAAVLAMLGYTADEFLALTVPDIIAHETPDVIARTVRHIDDQLAADGRCDLGRKHLRRKDGSAVPVDVRVTLVPSGGAGLHAVVVKDISEQVEHEDRLFEYQSQLEDANQKLRQMATTDGLTGVNNRAAFNTKLAEEYDRATRYEHPLSVVMLDVDHFKPFNDTFGHPAGDEVLRAVARTLKESARSSDVVARYGGEEFVIVLPDTDYAGAMVLAERFRRAVAGQPWDKRAVTVSVGVATLTPTTGSAEELVEEADQALYRSKEAGRNRVNHRSGAISMAQAIRS
jgi:diguanylate cyclase (GGDEF)-like protein/PAS domain S-box-containing protein